MLISETLQKAKEVLLDQGWHKGVFELGSPILVKRSGPVCLTGAVQTAAGVRMYRWSSETDEPASRYLNRFISDLPGNAFGPELWNDEESRTFDEVLAILDDATLAAKEQGL